MYILQVLSSGSDTNGNSLTPDTIILFSGTASLVYVITAAVFLWEIGRKRVALVLPITFLATGAALFLTQNPSVLNVIINAVRVFAFVTYFYAVWLIFVSDSKRTVAR